MSAVASFYLIPDDKRSDLVRAAEAQSKALTTKRFGFLPPKLPLNPDPFWEYIRAYARELDDYPFSGYLLLDIELLAPNTLGTNDDVGTDLVRIVKSSFVSYRAKDATDALGILDSTDFSGEAIKAFLTEEGREGEYPEIVTPIQQSVEHLKKWFGQVTNGNTGILTIG